MNVMSVNDFRKKHATLMDVCKAAGVSTATVSRVINKSPLVREPTRKRVMEVIEALGYRPSYAARTLARQRTDSLGVILPEIGGGFFAEVLCGIDGVAVQHEMHLMTAFSHGRNDQEELLLRVLSQRRVDAVICVNLSLPEGFIRETATHGMPIILIGRPVEGANLISVTLDNGGGAEKAITHLLEHGYKKIVVLAGPKGNFDADHRLEGCRRAMARANVDLPEEMIWQGAFTEESGMQAMEAWLSKGKPLPEAIFACNDSMALGVLEVLHRHQHRVPEDIALIGFDDIETARHLGLTSVHVPMRELGAAAAEAAFQQISGGVTHHQRVLSTSLTIRTSCRCKGKAGS